MVCYIYLISSCRGNYIGTSIKPNERWKQHKRDYFKTKSCSSTRVLNCPNASFSIIDKCKNKDRFHFEKHYINNVFSKIVNFQFNKHNKAKTRLAKLVKKGRSISRKSCFCKQKNRIQLKLRSHL